MHIGFLTPEYPHAATGSSGGLGTSIANLASGLLNAGHRVSVLVYAQSHNARIEDNGLVIHRIRNVKFKGFSRWLTQKKIQKLINHLVENEDLDLIEAADWTGITSAIRPKCPVVVKLHGSDTYFCHLDKRPVKPVNMRRERDALLNANALLSVSKYTADITSELFGLEREFTVIPNGIDPAKFTAASKPQTSNVLLYFGTLIRKKGLLELPYIFNEVVARNPTAKLLLVGKDASDILTGNPSTWALMQPLFSTEALANTTFTGPVPHAQMQNHIAAANVCVFPTFAEALPVSWIEAMAMQKAIVASNIGWANEIIDDGTDGFLVNPKEHALFASRINQLLNDPGLSLSMAGKAREKAVRRFSMTAVAARHEAFYLNVIREYTT